MIAQTVPDKRGRIRFTRNGMRFVVTGRSVKTFYRAHVNGKNYEEACEFLTPDLLNDEELLAFVLKAKVACRANKQS